jgi:hypothetical protein
MSSYLIDEIEAAGNIEVRPNAELTACSGDGVLETITLRDRASGHTEPVPAAAVFIQISAEPYTAWLPPEIRRDAWGYLLTGRDLPAGSWPLERPPLMLETSVPGVLRRATPARARRSESPPPLAKDRSSSNRSTSCSTPGTPRAPRPAGTLREPRSVLGEITSGGEPARSTAAHAARCFGRCLPPAPSGRLGLRPARSGDSYRPPARARQR